MDTLDTPLDPKNANRYAYAGDDPINNIDPLGLSPSTCTASRNIIGIGVFTAGSAALEIGTFAGAAATGNEEALPGIPLAAAEFADGESLAAVGLALHHNYC